MPKPLADRAPSPAATDARSIHCAGSATASLSPPPASDRSTGFGHGSDGREVLEELARARMPFGRYKGRLLVRLPEAYLVWLRHRGFPRGKLGNLLETALVIRSNGLESLLRPLLPPE